MSKKNDHLNDCLERLLQGEDLESCLQDYPKEAEELRLLLEMASGIRRYAKTIKLRPEFIAQTQANLGKAYGSKYCSWKARIAGMLKPVGHWTAVATAAIAILVFTFAGGLALSALASEDTMPGQALYPVKLATEGVRVAFAFSDAKKVDLLTQFAETRAEEIAYVVEKGGTDQVEAGLERLEAHLSEVEHIHTQIAQSKVPRVMAAEGYEDKELRRIESAVRDSSTRAVAKLKNIPADPETRDKIIARVEIAYSKAMEAIQSAR